MRRPGRRPVQRPVPGDVRAEAGQRLAQCRHAALRRLAKVTRAEVAFVAEQRDEALGELSRLRVAGRSERHDTLACSLPTRSPSLRGRPTERSTVSTSACVGPPPSRQKAATGQGLAPGTRTRNRGHPPA